MPAAETRVVEATTRLRAALASLPNVAAPPPLAKGVAELKRLPPALDDIVLRTMRTTLDAAGRALADSQAQADEQYFRGDESVRALCTSLGSRSRQELLEEALTQQGGGLLASLPAGTPVLGFSFASDDELRSLPL
jgi:hypothetical protein